MAKKPESALWPYLTPRERMMIRFMRGFFWLDWFYHPKEGPYARPRQHP